MLRVIWQVLLLAGLLTATAGLLVEQRAGRWRASKAAFVVFLVALLLAATGAVLALIGTALE